jgi:hypothetical protein
VLPAAERTPVLEAPRRTDAEQEKKKKKKKKTTTARWTSTRSLGQGTDDVAA